jgi:hypothetical protein
MRIFKISSITLFPAGTRSKLLISCFAMICLTALTVWATPGAGLLFNLILSRGTVPTDVHQDIFIERDTANGLTPDNNQGDKWSVKFYKSRSQEKNLSRGRNFSFFAAHVNEQDLF